MTEYGFICQTYGCNNRTVIWQDHLPLNEPRCKECGWLMEYYGEKNET